MNYDPKVTVCIVTYNQEKYIAQCLQSIVDQVVDFPFEIVVSDDASKDKTPEIIADYAGRYPNLFRVFLHKSNMGAGANFVFVHEQAQGEYIAHVDGDDYCLPGKLQVQADFLDKNPDCNISWHRMLIEYPDGFIKDGQISEKTQKARGLSIYHMRFDRAAIIQFIAVGANSSKMYRRSVREYEVADFEILDYFANVEQVGAGVACFVSCAPLGVYRTGVGVSSANSKTRLLLCQTFIYFSKKYPCYRSEVNTAVLTYLIADIKNFRGTWWHFFKVFLKTFHPSSILRLYRGMAIINQLRIIK